MDKYTLTEQAYKNGYEQGLRDAIKDGEWVVSSYSRHHYKCSVCRGGNLYKGGVPVLSAHCPHCGARMKGVRVPCSM